MAQKSALLSMLIVKALLFWEFKTRI